MQVIGLAVELAVSSLRRSWPRSRKPGRFTDVF